MGGIDALTNYQDKKSLLKEVKQSSIYMPCIENHQYENEISDDGLVKRPC